jgi:hypothetical protein
MIQCLCINDENRPKEIPESKWVKKGEVYSIIFAIVVLPQRQLALQIDELDLDESCMPYEYFLANRFTFRLEDISKLHEFIDECGQTNLTIQEIMQQTEVA